MKPVANFRLVDKINRKDKIMSHAACALLLYHTIIKKASIFSFFKHKGEKYAKF
jgi:hypothetical protein